MSEDRGSGAPRGFGARRLSQSVAAQFMLRKPVDASPDGLAPADGFGTLVLGDRRLPHGLRTGQITFQAEISLSPVPAEDAQFMEP